MQVSRKQQRIRAKEGMIDAAITIGELPIEEWAGWVVHLLERLDMKAHARNSEYDVYHPRGDLVHCSLTNRSCYDER